jgi:hypothetical protein
VLARFGAFLDRSQPNARTEFIEFLAAGGSRVGQPVRYGLGRSFREVD